jgi:hypothetical protein
VFELKEASQNRGRLEHCCGAGIEEQETHDHKMEEWNGRIL